MGLKQIELLDEFIQNQCKDQLECIGEKQSKINIDYPIFNEYFKKERNLNFLEDRGLDFLNSYENNFNVDVNPKHYTSFKLTNLEPNTTLKELDATNNGDFISAKAMIKNITPIRVGLKSATFRCKSCQTEISVKTKDEKDLSYPNLCKDCGGRSFELVKEKSTYYNYRYVKLEEPLELRNGGVTREFKGIMKGYLASPYHNLKAGDVVDISGTFQVETIKHRNKVDDFEFIIDLHNITPVDDAFEDYRITESDKKMLRELSQRQDIYELLVNTLAPEMYGYDTIKEGILLQLFEGSRPLDDSMKTDSMDRWTTHILIIGDPGIGKSQLIQAIKKRAPKVIYIAGTNTSQPGLTASAVKDELTGSWAMEAGAVVLADTGLLCIDEYDKLSSSAQKSLNEPMEQLSVSPAKAGIVQNMSARTSIIACANPKYSRFYSDKDYKDQIDIADSNLSRFDLVFALRDEIDEDKDNCLANALLDKVSIEEEEKEVLPVDVFKKYITYAKTSCSPVLSVAAKQLLVEFYVNTRQAAKQNPKSKPITARDLKALERLTIEKAKTRLSDVATVDDARNAIRIYSYSLETIGLTPETAGARESVKSDDEIRLISETEDKINAMIRLYGYPLKSEDYDALMYDVSLIVEGTDYHESVIFSEALRNVEKSL